MDKKHLFNNITVFFDREKKQALIYFIDKKNNYYFIDRIVNVKDNYSLKALSSICLYNMLDDKSFKHKLFHGKTLDRSVNGLKNGELDTIKYQEDDKYIYYVYNNNYYIIHIK